MKPVKEGRYKARAIKGSEQYGETANGTPQIAIDLEILELQGRRMTTFLYGSRAAKPYTIERLRLLGWDGDDLSDLDGIDANEVDVDIGSELFEGRRQWRVEIVTGPGRVTLSRTMDRDAFAARLAALDDDEPGLE